MLELTDRAWPLLLERVCRRRAVEPAFQPIVDVARGVVCGYEGLARIQEPKLATGPQQWFRAAAHHGFSARLEAVALTTMLPERRRLPRNCFLTVNTSPEGLMSPEVIDVLAAEGDLSGVVLEITEQSPVDDYRVLLEHLQRLRAAGAIVAVDDTGAGYASIRHLLAIRPEIVKLDRSLVTGIDHDPSRAAAVSALGAFAGVLDAWIIAEGVERLPELERLIELEVPLAQGFYLGRPSPTMAGLEAKVACDIQDRRAQFRSHSLSVLARPAPAVQTEPAMVAEATVLVDAHGRPLHVFLPAPGQRARRHPAMCVQASDDLAEVGLRAVARRSEDRLSPVCLCDEFGRFAGLLHLETVLEQLAAHARDQAEQQPLPV